MSGRYPVWRMTAAVLLLLTAAHAHAVEDWFDKGLAALRDRRYSEAISAFNKAIDQNPDHFGAHNSRGAAWHKMGVYERAIRDYTAALHLNPDYAGAYNNRGVAWYQKGDTVRAIADYDRALSLDPDYVSARQNRAAAWRRMGAFDRAIEDLRKAEKRQPSYEIYLQLAWILAACPDPRFRNGPAAEDFARKAVALRSDADSLGALAAAYAEQGRFDDALRLEQQILHDLEAAGDSGAAELHRKRLQSFRTRMPLGKTYLAGFGPAPRPFSLEPKTTQESPPQSKAAREPKSGGPPVAPPAETAGAATTSVPEPKTMRGAGGTGDRTLAAKADRPENPVEPEMPEANRSPILFPFTVQVASFRDPDTAVREALRLREKGDPAFVSLARLPSRGGDWHRLFIGRFENREAALRKAETLKARDYRFARVVTMPFAVEIRFRRSSTSLQEVQRRLKRRHLLAYPVTEDGASATTRLMVGAFSSPEQAALTVEHLRADGLPAEIVSHPILGGGAE